MDTGGPRGRRAGEPGHAPEDYRRLIEILYHMLEYEPEKRMTPAEALQSAFFQDPTRRLFPSSDAPGPAGAAVSSEVPPITTSGGPTPASRGDRADPVGVGLGAINSVEGPHFATRGSTF